MTDEETPVVGEKRSRPDDDENQTEESSTKQPKTEESEAPGTGDSTVAAENKQGEETETPPATEPEAASTSETKAEPAAEEPKVEEPNPGTEESNPETKAETPTESTAPVAEPQADAQPAPTPSPAPATQVPATSGNAPVGPAALSSVPGLPPGFGAPQGSNPNDMVVEEKGTVSALFVGRVIGKGGEMIRDLQARSSCRIDVDQDVPPGQPRVITYRGTRRTVDFAKRLVHMLCQENASEGDLPLGDAKREFLTVPAQAVGKIIGRGGEMIRELQARSQAKIQVDHNPRNGADQQKHVTITGADLAVTKAKEMILFLVENPMMDAMQALNMLVEDKQHRGGVWGSGPPYPNLPNMGQNMQAGAGGGQYGYSQPQQTYYGASQGAPSYGGPSSAPQPYGAPGGSYGAPNAMYQQPPPQQAGYGHQGGGGGMEMEVYYAAKTFMGRVIGQKGVTINDLQRRSGCDIQINQDVAPGRDCEISIRGNRQGIEMVKQMLNEIIEVGPNHPYAGGAGMCCDVSRILRRIFVSLGNTFTLQDPSRVADISMEDTVKTKEDSMGTNSNINNPTGKDTLNPRVTIKGIREEALRTPRHQHQPTHKHLRHLRHHHQQNGSQQRLQADKCTTTMRGLERLNGRNRLECRKEV
eukprot:Nitzschia sp. Nitz4//scaffold128_size63911//4124//6303//NITZ4_006211-RA/size63911-augustus-gene-0.90-mRNA-1//1//CDS//3329534808//1610//frame0